MLSSWRFSCHYARRHCRQNWIIQVRETFAGLAVGVLAPPAHAFAAVQTIHELGPPDQLVFQYARCRISKSCRLAWKETSPALRVHTYCFSTAVSSRTFVSKYRDVASCWWGLKAAGTGPTVTIEIYPRVLLREKNCESMATQRRAIDVTIPMSSNQWMLWSVSRYLP